jgi:hypothetical protein
MSDYAQIMNIVSNVGTVNMIVCADDKVAELQAAGLTIINVTSVSPKPSTGWTYNTSTQVFTAPSVPTRYSCVVALSKTEILANGTDSTTISGVIKNATGETVNLTQNFIIPMVRTDASGITIYDTIPRQLVVTAGSFSFDFTTTTRGYYTVQQSSITNLISGVELYLSLSVLITAYI